jgi:hypothetical protein
MADYFEKVLTDASANLNVDGYRISSQNFPGAEGPSWSITKFGLNGGKQQGVELVEIDNGYMTVVVVPTRGMAILEACTDEVSMGWSSPVRQLVHPAYVQEESSGGLGWLEGFNEMVCRRGLAFNGAPGRDTIPANTGEETEVDLPLHGTIANSPATRLAVRVQVQPPYELSVVGEVLDSRMFGAAYRLVSHVSTVPGTAEFTIRDEVQNLKARPAELELIYHCNYGRPLLGEGARVLAPAEFVCPRDERAKQGIEQWETYGAPEAGYAEQVYFLRNFADKNDRTLVALVDADERRAATVRYSVEQLPAFTVWKNTAAEPDGYVTGIEPGTDYPNNRSFERSKGRVVELSAGAPYSTELTFGVVSGADKLAALQTEIEDLMGEKATTVSKKLDPEYCPE